MRSELAALGTVDVVAPLVEQSGVSHTITYLTPLIAHRVERDEGWSGWAVSGSPADCVKLALLELCKTKPDLIVSGINSGANVGINVLYSGTVAAAIEGAFFGTTSIAVSLHTNDHPNYHRAAHFALQLIRQLLETQIPAGSLWNINLPESRADYPLGVRVLPMGLERYRERMERRTDPRGRSYFWNATDARSEQRQTPDTDVEAVLNGYATITPLQFDLTQRTMLADWSRRPFSVSE